MPDLDPRPSTPARPPLGAILSKGEALVRYLGRIRLFLPNAKLYLVGSFLMGIGHGAVWVHMNLYFKALGINEEIIGRILAAGSLGNVLVAVPAAMLVDRWPPSRVFTTAAVGYAALIALQLSVHSPWLLAAASLATGMLFTVHWVAAAPFFARNSRDEERIYLFGFAHAMENLATIGASVGVGWAAHAIALRVGAELTGLRIALAVVAGVTLLAAWPFARIQGTAPAQDRRSWRSYLAARDWPLIARLTVPGALVGMGAGFVIPFLNLYFRDRFQQGPDAIGVYFALSQALTVIGLLAGPAMARRMGSVPAMVLTELCSIPFFLILAFAQSLPLAVGAFLARGALMNMNHPVQQNFAMEMVPDDQRVVTNSIRMLAWNGCWMVSTQVGGWLIHRHGFQPPMLITIALYLLSAVLFWSFFGNRERHK